MKNKFILTAILSLSIRILSATEPSLPAANYSQYFEKAYQQYPSIPRGVLEAVSYTNTHIQNITHQPGEIESCIGMPKYYGVMGLVPDGKNYFNNNLKLVSTLSGISEQEIMDNPEKNILAYADAYRKLQQQVNAGTEMEKQIPVIVSLSELPDNGSLQNNFAMSANLYSVLGFLNDADFAAVYNFPQYHTDLEKVFGAENYKVLSSSQVNISEEEISGQEGEEYELDNKLSGQKVNPGIYSTDYSPALWSPAASCNYSTRSTSISAVTIHTVQGSYAGCISWFKNCNANVSAHYVVRSSDGQVTQMVVESKKAWHVGSENPYTIGIEHEGYISQTGWYTAAMYQSSAKLVKDICNSGYGINPTTCYKGASCNGTCTLSSSYRIKGHQHYPNQSHTDPGPNWNWGTYYNYINGCGTPSGLAVSSLTACSAKLSWSAISGATKYNVQYKKTSSSTWTSTTTTSTSKSISGLSASTAYHFRVQAVCGVNSNYSSAKGFTTPTASCGTAGSLAVSSVTPCAAKLSWGAVSGSIKYNVQYKQASSTTWTTTSTTSSYKNISGLSASTGYEFKVQAVCCIGGSYSAVKTFSTIAAGTPTSLSVTSITTTSAKLNWVAVSGASSYNVQYKAATSGTWKSTTSTTNYKSMTGLSASTKYEFKVQAICCVTGGYSAVKTFTTAAPPTSSTIQVGTGTLTYSAHPYSTVYMDERTQYIFTKSELAAAGWSSSMPYIKSLAFEVSTAAAQSMNSFKVTMAHTSSSSFGTSFIAGSNATVVYSGTAKTIVGWNTYTFSTPFHYNGTSNIVITICWNNSSYTSNSAIKATSYAGYMALYYRKDLSSGGVCSQATGTQSYYRPNTKLKFASAPMAPSGDDQKVVSETPEDEFISETTEEENLRESSEAGVLPMAAALTIYPNPSDGNMLYGKFTRGTPLEEDVTEEVTEAQTENPLTNNNMIVKIYDLFGREIAAREVSVEQGEFSLSLADAELKSGMYMLVGIINDKQYSQRLVVK